MAPNSPIINDNNSKGLSGIIGAPTYSPTFDINKLLKAAQDYAAINALANSMFGYDFKWFRAVPQQRSRDVIFQEYTLSNVDECPLDVKAVVPGGNFPDSKYNYDLMGLEYEIPLEIQIDKKYWESIAGFGTAPQKKDIVYMVLANKLYQVESAYLFRGYMEQETTWKINLVKYQPEASRREGDTLKETIDIYTVGAEEIFGGQVQAEVERIVNDKQFNQFNGTSQDKYKKVDSTLKTISEPIDIFGTIAAQSFYDMRTPTWYDAIIYNTGDIINVDMDRSITAWLKPLPVNTKLFNVTSIINIEESLTPSELDEYDASLYSAANYTITIDTVPTFSDIRIDDNIVVSRPGVLNFYAKIVAISVNPLRYHCIINPFVLEDLQNLTPTKGQWSTQKGYKLQVKEPISILDGVNDFGEHVLSVNIFANQYIAINYSHTYSNENAYVIRMEEKLNDDQWYGLVVNIGNTWGQYNVYVWEKHDTDKNAKLKINFYETLRLYPEHIAINHYTVNKSPAYLTNLRLFKCGTIEEEKQATELLSYFSKDGDQLIIGDNADPLLLLPYISKQK
jgi:hypothetical protein